MIAERLTAIGYTTQHAVSADTARTIAEDVALEVVTMTIEELERQGKLSGACQGHTPEIRIVRREMPERTIQGTAPKWFRRALKLAEVRQNILLVGPAGAGKSYGAKMLAESLGLPFYALSLTAGVDEGNVQGWLLPVGDGGRFEYVCSVVAHAFTEGGMVLFDELDAMDPNMGLIMNTLLDGNGFWSIPIRYKEPMLKRHPDFRVVAAANTHGHGPDRKFVGRNQLDGATLSRFRNGQINVDYDEEMEKRLYPIEVLTYGHLLRARCRALGQGWTRDVSTRDLGAWTELLPVMDSVEQAVYGYFEDWSETELERVHAVRNHDRETVVLR